MLGFFFFLASFLTQVPMSPCGLGAYTLIALDHVLGEGLVYPFVQEIFRVASTMCWCCPGSWEHSDDSSQALPSVNFHARVCCRHFGDR